MPLVWAYPPTLIAGTALLPTTLVMAVGNGVIGSKFAAPPTPIHVVSEAATSAEANQQDFLVTHEVYQVQATATKGIYVDLNMSSTSAPRPLRFQVDSGCSCNTIHSNDLKQLPPTQVHPSMIRLLDYPKSIIPDQRASHFTLHKTWCTI